MYHWLVVFMKDHPIPRDGAWDDVSGESFLRLLLSMPIEHASYTTVGSCGRLFKFVFDSGTAALFARL